MKITQPKSMSCQHDTKTYPFCTLNSQYLCPSAHEHNTNESSINAGVHSFLKDSFDSSILHAPKIFLRLKAIPHIDSLI